MDHAHQRRRPPQRALVQPVHRGPQGGEHRARPEGARRPGDQRPGEVQRDRRAGEGCAGAIARRDEIFLRQAAFCDGRSPLYASLCRRLAGDGRVDRIAPDLRWDLPLRLLGGLHYLVLGGLASWDDLDGALDTHGDFLRRHAAEQQVQTNEVQRSYALLPAFLAVADGRPLDVLELGPSAGLNLVWDRYAYRYRTGDWGAAELVLSGDDRVPPPASLLARD